MIYHKKKSLVLRLTSSSCLDSITFLIRLRRNNAIAFYLSVIVGAAVLVPTIITDHQTGLLSLIPYRLHLLVDATVAIVFLLAPFIFSFKRLDAYYYWINSAAVLLVVSLHFIKLKLKILLSCHKRLTFTFQKRSALLCTKAEHLF